MKDILDQPISEFIDSALIVLDSNQKVSEGVKKMEESGTDSILISDGGKICGIVTHRNVLFDVVARGRDPAKTELKQIMRSPLFGIQKESKVKDAVSLMSKNNVRRLVVYENDVPIGMITKKMLVGNITSQSIALPELEIPNKIKCPYCSSIFDNNSTLSKHIDDIHIGRGLFEGNLSRREDLGSINPPYDHPKTI